MSVIRVLIADDHPVLTSGLEALFEAEEDLELVGTAADGKEAIARVRESQPDVAVVDITMPGMTGIETIRQIRQDQPTVACLVLTMHEDARYLRRALDAGAMGYVIKRAAGKELLLAIRAVAGGQQYIDASFDRDDLEVTDNEGPGDIADAEVLSPREREVLVLVAHGHTNREIAEQLGLSKGTVDTYRVRLTEKLGLKNRADLVRFALQAGLMSSEP